MESEEQGIFRTTVFILALAVFMLFILPQASAEKEYATATLTLTIINQPPRIQEVSISPAAIYSDSKISCKVDFFDEDKGAKVHYQWKVDGEFRGREPEITGLKEGEIVECKAYVRDFEGLPSNRASVFTEVKHTPIQTRATKTLLAAAGVEVEKQELEEKRKDGLMAFTSFAAKESFRQRGHFFGGMMLFVFAILTAILVLNREAKPAKSKTRNKSRA